MTLIVVDKLLTLRQLAIHRDLSQNFAVWREENREAEEHLTQKERERYVHRLRRRKRAEVSAERKRERDREGD